MCPRVRPLPPCLNLPAPTPPPAPPSLQVFLSVFESRWGSGRGSFAFMLILFIASNFCGRQRRRAAAPGVSGVQGSTRGCAPPWHLPRLPAPCLLSACALSGLWQQSPNRRAAAVVRHPTHPAFVLLCAGTFCVTSNSRMLYAFARDHGVIGSHWWKQINNYTGTPINSIIGMCLAAILIGLTMLGSSVAFIAISSIGGCYVSLLPLPAAAAAAAALLLFLFPAAAFAAASCCFCGAGRAAAAVLSLATYPPASRHPHPPARHHRPRVLLHPAHLPAPDRRAQVVQEGALPPGPLLHRHWLDRRRVGLLHLRGAHPANLLSRHQQGGHPGWQAAAAPWPRCSPATASCASGGGESAAQTKSGAHACRGCNGDLKHLPARRTSIMHASCLAAPSSWPFSPGC